VPVIDDAEERRRVVADVVGAEWNHFGGLQWTPELVAEVDADLAAGDLENHFHESVPYVQLGLLLLLGAQPDDSADDDVLIGLVKDFVPSKAAEATPAAVERTRQIGRASCRERV